MMVRAALHPDKKCAARDETSRAVCPSPSPACRSPDSQHPGPRGHGRPHFLASGSWQLAAGQVGHDGVGEARWHISSMRRNGRRSLHRGRPGDVAAATSPTLIRRVNHLTQDADRRTAATDEAIWHPTVQ
jgi:hypothetical protein